MEARIPKRKIFQTFEEGELDLEFWKNISNCSISVWTYNKIYYENNHFMIDYDTANIDRLFFDIDCLSKTGAYYEDRYNQAIRLIRWAEERDYNREIIFTGGGFQILISARTTTDKYIAIMKDLGDKLKIDLEDCVSTANLMRFVGSYNNGKYGRKISRKSWCVSLPYNLHYKPYPQQLEYASKERMEHYRYGKEVYVPPVVLSTVVKKRVFDMKTNFSVNDDVNKILEHYGFTYEDICPNIRQLIEQLHVGNVDRVVIIKYLKTVIGISYGDILIILPKLLVSKHGNGNDGTHSIEEGQPLSVYSHNLFFNPDYTRKLGICPQECHVCDGVVNYVRTTMHKM